MEKLIDIVTAYPSGGSLVVSIPKEARKLLSIKAGAKFKVLLLKPNRIILERLEE